MLLNFRTLAVLAIFSILTVSQAQDVSGIESRGKKKKIGLFVYFADLVVKKIFILKLIYAFVLWCVIHKAGYFLWWFVSYLKQQKKEHEHHHHDHHEPHFEYGPPHGHEPHFEYGPPHGHIPSYDSYGPYRKSYRS